MASGRGKEEEANGWGGAIIIIRMEKYILHKMERETIKNP